MRRTLLPEDFPFKVDEGLEKMQMDEVKTKLLATTEKSLENGEQFFYSGKDVWRLGGESPAEDTTRWFTKDRQPCWEMVVHQESWATEVAGIHLHRYQYKTAEATGKGSVEEIVRADAERVKAWYEEENPPSKELYVVGGPTIAKDLDAEDPTSVDGDK